jgi:multiple sugar transport system permease protein
MTGGRGSLHKLMARKSTIGFLMTLPLLTLLMLLVAYPAGSAIYLSMLDRGMTKFVGLDNFARLFASERFWILICQTSLYAIIVVVCGAIIGFAAAHFLHTIPIRGQRKWRGMLLVPWVIPPVMSMLAWRQLIDPSFSAFNWILEHVGIHRISWLAEAGWARFTVILATVWMGAPFFMIMYLAALKSVPDELHEASSIDGASWWQRTRYVTLPMTRNVIAITMLFSLIGGFTGFTIVNHGGVLRRPRGRQLPEGCCHRAVHGAGPGGGRGPYPANHCQARERSLTTDAGLQVVFLFRTASLRLAHES